jgi:hypothetical protein
MRATATGQSLDSRLQRRIGTRGGLLRLAKAPAPGASRSRGFWADTLGGHRGGWGGGERAGPGFGWRRRGSRLRPRDSEGRTSLGVPRIPPTCLCAAGFDAIIASSRRNGQRGMAERRELLTWEEVTRLIDHLVPQFQTEFEAMVIITRGGVVPGGLLGEALGVQDVLTAGRLPFELERSEAWLLVAPVHPVPRRPATAGRKVLVVDDVWAPGGPSPRSRTGWRRRRDPVDLCPALQPLPEPIHPGQARLLRSHHRRHIVYPWRWIGAGSVLRTSQTDGRAAARSRFDNCRGPRIMNLLLAGVYVCSLRS